MPWGVVAAAITAGGAIYSSSQARKTQQATQDASAAADPFSGMRPEFQEMLRGMFPSLSNMDPASIVNDPAYKFEKQQGMEAMDNSMAANGLLRSGSRPLAAADFASGLAAKYSQNQFGNKMQLLQLLAGLAGSNAGNPGMAGQIAANGINNQTSLVNSGINAASGAVGQLSRVNWSGPGNVGAINWNTDSGMG